MQPRVMVGSHTFSSSSPSPPLQFLPKIDRPVVFLCLWQAMDDYDVSQLISEFLVVFVAATSGQGKTRRNASLLLRYPRALEPPQHDDPRCCFSGCWGTLVGLSMVGHLPAVTCHLQARPRQTCRNSGGFCSARISRSVGAAVTPPDAGLLGLRLPRTHPIRVVFYWAVPLVNNRIDRLCLT